MISYRDKYLKYKKKYMDLKSSLEMKGGVLVNRCDKLDAQGNPILPGITPTYNILKILIID